eukprot:TRINITY_DN1482_c0_g1_i1.p1 TRINITY_DN1482_c0_g1~~TRINITY_DN1482_c0_g1_i1.p1  ORF type:complete len:218 (+),score=94.36 TRINITY_DN1482_c0_g1_i1:210-863(+)
MSIAYACIADSSGMVCFVSKNPSLDQMARLLIDSIDLQTDHRKSYQGHAKTKNHSFQYIVSDQTCYLSAATETFPQRICFSYLERIRAEYIKNFMGKGKLKGLENLMASEMDFFSNNPEADKLRNVVNKVDEVKGIMHKNVEDLLQRGERIEYIEGKAQDLKDRTVTFQKQAERARCALCKQNMKVTICLIITAIVLLCVIVGGAVLVGVVVWKTAM